VITCAITPSRIRADGTRAGAWVVVVRTVIGPGTNPRRIAAKRM
jgi:hypothetical protein